MTSQNNNKKTMQLTVLRRRDFSCFCFPSPDPSHDDVAPDPDHRRDFVHPLYLDLGPDPFDPGCPSHACLDPDLDPCLPCVGLLCLCPF